eukprot:TRINITY_DN54645_c0_g1_i1.p4 TRINITY_DN54645_c0_g1~~TRINITY_DN54645_c0_g1_i1.p4  ORF type:complete len:101 (+),score=12.06 TRINITY_DN54645_c0_g1_i1:35-304(+)
MTLMKVPGAHREQATDPDAFAKLPSSHGRQLRAPVSAMYEPGLQAEHPPRTPASRAVPLGHNSQAVWPTLFWLRPAGQSEHRCEPFSSE